MEKLHPYIFKLRWTVDNRGSLEAALRSPVPLRPQRKVRIKEEFASVDKDWVKDLLSNLDTHKSMDPNEMHVQVLRELAEATARPLSIIFDKLWGMREVP